MNVHVESNIEFDFTKAHRVVEYENLFAGLPGASPNQRNQFWPGIDFHIEDAPDDVIWLEVKSWNPAQFAPRDRGGQRRSFQCKMKSKSYPMEVREKFLGASAFFAWDSRPIPLKVRFLLLLEPPHPMDSALILTFGHKVRSQLMPPRILTWRRRMEVSALTLAEWNRRFPDYPARII